MSKPALALLVIVTLCHWAYLQPSASQPAVDPVEAVCARFGVDLTPADVVVLVDVSGSMTGKYDDVRAAVVEFVRSLGAQDNLHLRYFSSTVSVPLEGRGDAMAAEVSRFLPREPLPGRGTDLGRALEAGIQFLSREEASEIQGLFLVTDGLHEPPAASPFSRETAADPDWRRLARAGAAINRRPAFYAHGFGIGGETDIGLLATVFPGKAVHLAPGSPNQVGAALAAIRRRLRRSQAALAVARELRSREVVTALAQEPRPSVPGRLGVRVDIRNRYPHLSVRLRGVSVSWSGDTSGWKLDKSPVGVVLPPGGRWSATAAAPMPPDPSDLRVGERTQEWWTRLTVTPRVTLAEEELARELRLREQPRARGAATEVVYRKRHGLPALPLLLLPLALALAPAAWLRQHRRRPTTRLRGALTSRSGRIELEGFGNPAVLTADGVSDGAGRQPDRAAVTLSLQDDGEWQRLTAEWSHPEVSVRRGGTAIPSPAALESGDLIAVQGARFLVEHSLERSRVVARSWQVVAVSSVLLAGACLLWLLLALRA